MGEPDPYGRSVGSDDPVELGTDDDRDPADRPPDRRRGGGGDGDADADADADGDADEEPPPFGEPEEEEPAACVPAAEVCGNGIDEDCDGADALCPFVTVNVQGNCVTVTCPVTHPFPVACDIQFSGTDDDGCVAWQAPSSSVFFQDGDDCDDGGFLAGTLTCGRSAGVIDEATCVLRVENPDWEDEPDDC